MNLILTLTIRFRKKTQIAVVHVPLDPASVQCHISCSALGRAVESSSFQYQESEMIHLRSIHGRAIGTRQSPRVGTVARHTAQNTHSAKTPKKNLFPPTRHGNAPVSTHLPFQLRDFALHAKTKRSDLAQFRSVVRSNVLFGEHDNTATKVLLPQCLGRHKSGRPFVNSNHRTTIGK